MTFNTLPSYAERCYSLFTKLHNNPELKHVDTDIPKRTLYNFAWRSNRRILVTTLPSGLNRVELKRK